MHVLQILDQAFRTTVEEQDETIFWLMQSMLKKSIGDPENAIELLLTGNAVYYALQKLKQPKLKLGEWHQSQPADIHTDIKKLVDKGVSIMVVYEDLWDRGLEKLPLPEGVDLINRQALPQVFERADQVWHW
ncbi:hypothetical protein LP43_1186 [Methylophaga thiooxydans]|uniref:Uncharacterized protein n=1 Tax=Methylophaga thiooxydans TaxID=392484 RepID=A0A0A0BHX9_9GAMM|nr:hypothetical protein [Methylophaga thiooxydans]KGM07571.1 hypothetical protein LP43_1186 [Methylophaga thiooxydans]